MYKKSLDRATLGKVERARAAEANALENLPVFAAAVICGNMAGLDVGTLNSVSWTTSFHYSGFKRCGGSDIGFEREKGWGVVEIFPSFSLSHWFCFSFSEGRKADVRKT